MHTLQNTMLDPIHLRHPLSRRGSPRQKHDPVRPLLRHDVNHLLRELLPTMIRMTVGLVRSHRQTRIQE